MDFGRSDCGKKKKKKKIPTSSSEAVGADLSSQSDEHHQKVSLPQRLLHRCRIAPRPLEVARQERGEDQTESPKVCI